MAFDPSSMLLNLSPTKGVDLMGSLQQAQQMSAQRQQMKLAREKFDFDKRQAEENKRLRELEEQGQMARARMQAEREREQAQAVKDAALLAEQQKQLAEVGKLAGTGQVQQAQAMAPLLDQLGYNLNDLGSVGGLPVFQLQNRAQEAERAAAVAQARAGGDEMAGLGYPTDERGTLDDTQASVSTLPDDLGQLTLGGEDPALDAATSEALMPGEADLATSEEFAGDAIADVDVQAGGLGVASLSGQDPFARALASSRQAEATGMPTRGPDEEDFMGAVPRNVIDLPAMNAQTLARLSPALQARVGALPMELQDGAEANAAAIGGLGLEADAALKEFDTAMQDPVSIYNSQQNLLAQKEKDENDPVRIAGLQTVGETRAAKLAEERGVSNILKAVTSAQVALDVLADKDTNNDSMIAPALMDAQGVSGVPSNTDLLYALGMEKASLLEKGIAYIQEKVRGGFSDAQKEAIKNYLKAVQESQKTTVTGFLDSAYDRVDRGDMNQHVKDGYLGKIEQSVPAWMYNDYHAAREKSGKGRKPAGQSAPTGEAGPELQRQAEAAGLNGQVLGQLMGGESGGDPKAANENRTDGGPKSSAKGVFQLTNETARLMGYKDAAAYRDAPLEEQIEVGLKLFKNKGLDANSPPEDYALVLAAPSWVGKWKSRDDVVYKKGSIEWEGNAPWRPAGGGDITVGSITDYYVKGEGREISRARAAEVDKADASATAPSKAASEAPSKLKLPEPKNDVERRIADLLKKRGG